MDAKALRRLAVGEVVQILEGPVKEETADVDRVRVRSMEDKMEGWVSVAGNAGSAYLRPGVEFRVLKETLITESFDIEAPKDEARKINMVSKKLKPGEILELREWGRTHEETGLTRMKCRVKSDGSVGYVTSVGNTGIKFVESFKVGSPRARLAEGSWPSGVGICSPATSRIRAPGAQASSSEPFCAAELRWAASAGPPSLLKRRGVRLSVCSCSSRLRACPPPLDAALPPIAR
eukprot:CAMPEP_0176243644 /NCGR_PEP_ID=MMETSP0121_2-20121125/31029_1 /TAXON_ID=160619 /ORGANISM="Kryptoperidinium foliaceum, Strain CCMP 1326" /LENGTH=233 /DNA_ID=CAMNT_0017583241 /DNA_START=15 /DNA_END=713 /DNA_ORIENTATION=-